ncbi:MAG: glycosyltransferase [Acidimicrobiales bacterium]
MRLGRGAVREGELWEQAEPKLDLSLVVPYYNLADRLRFNVESLVGVLDRTGVSYELIAVSDGSTDGSERALTGMAPSVRSVVLERNSGKGQALRVGLAKGYGAYLGFIDADGDLPAEQLEVFVSIIRDEAPDIVVGSKRHPASRVVYPPLRRLYSWGYQQLVSAMFDLSVRDTQTGLKFVRRDVLAAALPLMVEQRFAFDLELLVVAARLGYRRVIEAPVLIQERFSSTISPRAVSGIMADTVAIAWRLLVLRRYG